jgi:hypothetical protein
MTNMSVSDRRGGIRCVALEISALEVKLDTLLKEDDSESLACEIERLQDTLSIRTGLPQLASGS